MQAVWKKIVVDTVKSSDEILYYGIGFIGTFKRFWFSWMIFLSTYSQNWFRCEQIITSFAWDKSKFSINFNRQKKIEFYQNMVCKAKCSIRPRRLKSRAQIHFI